MNDFINVFEDRVWIVNDEWLAQDRGLFFSREDAELFKDLLASRREQS